MGGLKYTTLLLLVGLVCYALAELEANTDIREAKNLPLSLISGRTSSFIGNPEFDLNYFLPRNNIGALQERFLNFDGGIPSFFLNPRRKFGFSLCGSRKCGQNTYCQVNLLFGNTCQCNAGYVRDPSSEESCLSPCSVPNACGSNTFCIANDGVKSCHCRSGFLPASPGDESTIGCVNPCSNSVCNQQNSVCDPITATQYQCVCNVGFKPIQNDAERFGCHQDCGTAVNAIYIVEKNYCLELFPYIANRENFASARDICQSFGGDLAVFDETDLTLESLLIKYYPSLITPSGGDPTPFLDDIIIGGVGVGGGFEWIDGTPLTGVAGGNNDVGDYVVILVPADGGEIDLSSRDDATQERGFLCQYNRP